MAASATAILKRNAKLRQQRLPYESLWQDMADYITPHRGAGQRRRAPGEKKTEKIYDSTAVRALPMLAAHIDQTLTPSTQPWLSFAFRDETLNTDDAVKRWAEDCARRMHRALRQSDFYVAVHEFYLDLIGPSATGCLLAEERDPPASGQFGGFRFRALPPEEYTIAENVHGRVDTVYRQFKLTARQILQRWPKTAGPRVEEKHRQDPDAEFEIVHAVQPREDIQYGDDGKAKRGARNMPWSSCYVLMDAQTNGQKGKLLEEGGYEENPYMVTRWLKASGEVYGFGPSHLALPDVMTMNAAKQFVLQAAPLSMMPPTLEKDDAVIGDLDLTPAGRNVVGGPGPISEQVAFMQTGLKVDVTQIVFADLMQSIRETYFVPQLELQDRPQMTATEVTVRYELMMRYLGAVLSRLTVEFLNPLVERCFGVMARARAFLDMPPILAETFGEADMDIEYEGILARAQRAVELTAQDRTIGLMMTVAQAKSQFPDEIWDNMDFDKIIRDRVEITGMRADSLRPAAAMTQLRDERKAQAEQAKQAQVMLEAGKSLGAFAPFMKQAQPAGANGQTERAA